MQDDRSNYPNSTELIKIRERFKSYLAIDEKKVRPFILDSWKRCRSHKKNGLFQEHVPQGVFDEALGSNKELLQSSTLLMEKLFSSVSAAHSVIGLADKDGLLLHVIGKEEDIQALSVIQKGYSASEENGGTNGIGTGLIERRPIEIIGAEHYTDSAIQWCCCSAPIFDGEDFVGVLNISIYADNYHFHTLGLVEAAAYAISEQLRLLRLIKEQNSMLEFLEEGVIILDMKNKVRAINEKAALMLHIADADIVGTPIQDIIKPCVGLDTILSSPAKIHNREYTLKLPHGPFQFIISSSPIEDGGTIFTLQNPKRMREYAAQIIGSGAVYRFENIIGNSTAIQETIKLAQLASKSDITTLILGESGVGKELFAQAIHNAGERASGPFVAINCGAIPRTLLESELFGYEEGAFTGARKHGKPGKFELADGGTIFLDEIGELPPEAQTSLLRFLQESEVVRVGGTATKHVNVRVIAATNRDIKSAIRQNTFRHDLYYRLAVLSISIPPLRERKTDIPLLARVFLKKFVEYLGCPQIEFSEEALETLAKYHWPGNVRELENVVERTVNIIDSTVIKKEDLPHSILADISVELGNACPYPAKQANGLLKNKESETIAEVLASCAGNMRQAALRLGISRCSLYRKLKTMGISPSIWREKH